MRSISALVLALAAGQAIAAAVPSPLEARADPAAVTCKSMFLETQLLGWKKKKKKKN